MAYTDPSTLTFATNENPLASAKLNSATNDQFLAVLPGGVVSTDWDPTLEATVTNPSVSVDGARYTIGAVEFLWARFQFSAVATPYGDGTYFVTLPNAATNIASSSTYGSGQVIGSWQARDSSVPTATSGEVLLRAADEIHFNAAGQGLLDNDAPWVWASGDVLSFFIQIPIA